MTLSTLRYAIDQVETSPAIDPHYEPASNRRYYETFEALTALGPDGTPGPGLAERWDRLSPTQVRLHLRPSARFHTGVPVTAADVAFSFERARVPRKSFTVAGRLGTVERMVAVDDHTVDVISGEPDPLLLARLAELMILSRAQLEGAPDGATPVGSGPYRIVQYDPGTVIRLERWDEHDSRRPPFETVEVHQAAPADREALLRCGELDLAMIRPSSRESLDEGEWRIVPGPVTANAGYFLDSVNAGWPTANRLVRQAMNFAVDKSRILKEVFGGAGEITPGQFAPAGCAGHHPGLRAYPHDPARARELLASAGYANGFAVTLDAVGYSTADVPKAERVAADLAEVGIQASISVISDLETSLQRWYGAIPRGHLSPTSLAIAPAMDVEYALLWFDSAHPTRHYANPAFDELHRSSRTELNPAIRLRQLSRAAQVLHEDPPFLWLVGEASIYAVRPGLDGFLPRSDGAIVPDGLLPLY